MKKMILGVTLAFAAISAQASYLAWQVDATTDGIDAYNMAALWGSNDSGTSLLSYTQNLPSSGFNTSENLNESSYSSYWVELYNYAENTATSVGRSDTYTYTQISGALASSLEAASLVAAFTASYTATPEPTSGLLMLMGFAMLGLKRKKEV